MVHETGEIEASVTSARCAMPAYTITRYVNRPSPERRNGRDSTARRQDNGIAEVSEGHFAKPSPLQSYYRERLTAHLDALRATMAGISEDGTDQQTASLRRITRVVQRSSGRYGFPDVNRAAVTASEAPYGKILEACEMLAETLTAAIAGNTVEKVGILVAVPDVDTEEMLKVTLSTSNREVLVARSAVDVRAALADQEISLLVLSVHLGPDNGRDLLVDIRTDENMDDVPVIMLCESTNPQVTAECFALGAVQRLRIRYYIDPPSEYVDLTAGIGRLATVVGRGPVAHLVSTHVLTGRIQRYLTSRLGLSLLASYADATYVTRRGILLGLLTRW